MCISANAAGNNVSAQNQLDINKYVQIFKGENSKVKVLFVGNSITRHAPKADIGWSGDWGMAASCREKDYVHLVVSALDKRYNGVDYCIAQAALWEVNYFDGDKVLSYFTPWKYKMWMQQHQQIISIVFLIILVTGILSTPLGWIDSKIYTFFYKITKWIPIVLGAK